MNLMLVREQRRALAAWMLAGSGPALLALIVLVVCLLAWGIPDGSVARINYIAALGLSGCLLLAIPLLTYGVDQALRTFKASGGGIAIEATGQEDGTAPVVIAATVTNAAGDSATASVPINHEET